MIEVHLRMTHTASSSGQWTLRNAGLDAPILHLRHSRPIRPHPQAGSGLQQPCDRAEAEAGR